MMATEDQAKKQWCPMVRASSSEDDHNASNAGVPISSSSDTVAAAGRSPLFARCIGSKCAMWRWAGGEPRRGFIPAKYRNAMVVGDADGTARGLPAPTSWEFWPADPDEDGTAGWYEPDEVAAKRREGFCGVAGKPEWT